MGNQLDRLVARDVRGRTAPSTGRPADNYRRGYVDCARSIVGSVEKLLPGLFAQQLVDWLADLEDWADHNRFGEHPPANPLRARN